MIFEELSNILSQNVPLFFGGTSLFINQAPLDGTFCGLFRDGPGGFEINGYIPTERKGFFVLAVRGKTEAEITNAVKLAMSALTINNQLSGNILIKICRPISEPVSYRLSVGNIKEISVNFSINYGIVQ